MARGLIPPEAIVGLDVNVMLAALRLSARGERLTFRSVMTEGGWGSTGSVQASMRRLRAVSLLAWEDGRRGTMRCLVAPVAVDLLRSGESP